jgi:hypothetical protein
MVRVFLSDSCDVLPAYTKIENLDLFSDGRVKKFSVVQIHSFFVERTAQKMYNYMD